MKQKSIDIAVITPNWLGDAVMSLPVLGDLSTIPGVRIRVVSSPYTARVYWELDAIDELIVLSSSGVGRRAFARAQALRELRVDAAILLPPSFSSAWTVFLAQIPVRIGFDTDARGMLLTHGLKTEALRSEHLSDNYRRLARVLFEHFEIGETGWQIPPRLRVFDNEREVVKEKLMVSGVPDEYVVVVPGATYGTTKSWPKEKFRRLVQDLTRETAVVLGGGAAEESLCASIADGVSDAFNMAGKTSAGEFFALLGGAKLLVANDSGAPHAAASLGTPTVVIFGSTSPTWTKPLGDHVDVVREPVHCSPCFLKKCPTHLECYAGITPERVVEVAMGRLRQRADEVDSLGGPQ